MIIKFLRSIRDGREDAKAVIAQPRFLELMDSIEKFPLEWQRAPAMAFVESMKKFADTARPALPEHLREDYLNHLGVKNLQRAAEHYFTQARTSKANAVRVKNTPESGNEYAAGFLFGFAQELVGYYLLAQSWLDLDSSLNLDYYDPAVLDSSPMIGTYIKTRIHEFLEKFGHRPPF